MVSCRRSYPNPKLQTHFTFQVQPPPPKKSNRAIPTLLYLATKNGKLNASVKYRLNYSVQPTYTALQILPNEICYERGGSVSYTDMVSNGPATRHATHFQESFSAVTCE